MSVGDSAANFYSDLKNLIIFNCVMTNIVIAFRYLLLLYELLSFIVVIIIQHHTEKNGGQEIAASGSALLKVSATCKCF